MKCPYCGDSESKVVNSRELPDAVRRRRECLVCHRRYTTFERLESSALLVVKRDGRREEFDRRKLFDGVRRACHKRPISVEQLDELVGRVEHELRSLGLPEVEAARIGEMVMARLKLMDDIAYVRYAAIYRRFQDMNSLMAEMEEFTEWKRRLEEEKTQLQLPV